MFTASTSFYNVFYATVYEDKRVEYKRPTSWHCGYGSLLSIGRGSLIFRAIYNIQSTIFHDQEPIKCSILNMKNILSRLRLKKLNELISVYLGRYHSINNCGDIRYGKSVLAYLLRPKFTTILEFCHDLSPDHGIESTIDNAYSKFILGEYNLRDKGADFKFHTIRNVFKNSFRTKAHVINHYANQLTLPVIRILKEEFADKDLLNITIPAKVNIMAVVREFENSAFEYIAREFNLVRAGPYNIRLVA